MLDKDSEDIRSSEMENCSADDMIQRLNEFRTNVLVDKENVNEVR